VTRPASYIRISGAADQIGNLSLPTQARLVEGYAARAGLPPPTLYEESRSAFTDDLEKRPVFARLVAAIERGEHDLLICYDQDRLARDAALALMVANRLTRAGCRIVLLNQPATDVQTPDGKLSFTIGAGISEYYSAQIGRKTRAGLAHIRASGGHVGGVPYGAVRDAARRLVVDPARADGLRALLTLAADRSAQAVAEALNAAGVPPPRRASRHWRESSVRGIVAAGRWLLDQPDPWPALWTAARSRPARPRGGAVARRHAVTGLLRCRCGGVVVGGASKRYADGRRRRAVVCRNVPSGRPRGRWCPHPHTYADRYEAGLGAWLLGIPDLSAVLPVGLPDVAAERARLAERRRVAGKLWDTGGIAEAEYDARIAAIAAEEAALPLVAGQVETLAGAVRAAQVLWPDALPEERNDLLRGLIARVVVGGAWMEVEPRPALAAFLAAVDYPLTAAIGPL
jgi:DNA invertase Pin-like site-specific DNA recombinase